MSTDKNSTKTTPKEEPNKKAVSEVPNFQGAMAEMSWSVALPFMVFVLGGNWIDGKRDSEPLFTVIGLFLALASAAIVVSRIIKKYYPDTYKSKEDKK